MAWYLLKQPKDLQTMATVQFGDWIALLARKLISLMYEQQQHDATKAEDFLSQQIEIIRNYLDCNVPRMFHNKLILEAIRALPKLYSNTKQLQNDATQTKVIGRMIEALFTKNLTCLLLDQVHGMSWFGASFYSKSHLLTGLIQLELLVNRRDPNQETYINESLKYLPHLKILFINICSDSILQCMVKNCPMIEEFKVLDSSINDMSVDILIKLNNLRNVYLARTDVTWKGVETLLISCNNLEDIIIDSEEIILALEHISLLPQNADMRFKLKCFTHHYGMTDKQLQLVVKMCPLIQEAAFSDNRNLKEFLIPLNSLEGLSKLSLMNFDFYTDQVIDVLKVRGRNLVTLHLEGDNQLDVNALMYINQMCPNLQSLTIIQCMYIEKQITYDWSNHKDTLLDIQPFRYLKSLNLESYQGMGKPAISNSPGFTEEHLIFMLANCPNVELLDIDVAFALTDDIMFKVLDKNPLIFLRDLAIWSRDNKLSELVIDRIVRNCINPPVVELTIKTEFF